MAALVTAEVAAIAEGGVAVIVGTRDSEGVPELVRAWGVRVLGGDQIDVCFPEASGQRTIENLADNQQIAVTLVLPTTYRSFQLKGRAVDTTAAGPDDIDQVIRHRQAFIEETQAVGMLPEATTRLFSAEIQTNPAMIRVRLNVEQVFDQTPGPGAGARL
jgi:hypothetical protein